MSWPKDHKQATRQRIVEAAAPRSGNVALPTSALLK
jgi:hypothetical protein